MMLDQAVKPIRDISHHHTRQLERYPKGVTLIKESIGRLFLSPAHWQSAVITLHHPQNTPGSDKAVSIWPCDTRPAFTYE